MTYADGLNRKYGVDLPPLFDRLGYMRNLELWGNRRREILSLFEEQVYGRTPAYDKSRTEYRVVCEEELPFDAVRRSIEITVPCGKKDFAFPISLYLPMDVPGSAPAFLLISRQDWLEQDRALPEPLGYFPIETLIRRGYATVSFDIFDVAPDDQENFTGYQQGIYQCFSFGEEDESRIGAIGIWAFCASRVMDVLEREMRVDASRVAVIGHSRLGKTALWCGAQDPRFALVISNESGAGGAALFRTKGGEHVEDLIRAVPYWFCDKFRQYVGREQEMPVDQHMLLACVAPRLLYVGSAEQDSWADPAAEFDSARVAGEVYEAVYDLPGILPAVVPTVDTPLLGGNIGYHMRSGEHRLSAYDWNCYIEFADRHWKRIRRGRKTGTARKDDLR